jgi:hypothetical protein
MISCSSLTMEIFVSPNNVQVIGNMGEGYSIKDGQIVSKPADLEVIAIMLYFMR